MIKDHERDAGATQGGPQIIRELQPRCRLRWHLPKHGTPIWRTFMAPSLARRLRDLANGLVEAPDMNIARTLQNGRTFEAFGEDLILQVKLLWLRLEAFTPRASSPSPSISSPITRKRTGRP